MRKKSGLKVRIHADVEAPRDVLEHFVRREVEVLRDETGDDERCEVEVERLADGDDIVYLASIELGAGPDPVLAQEMNVDPFVAVRNAFQVARRWVGEHTDTLLSSTW